MGPGTHVMWVVVVGEELSLGSDNFRGPLLGGVGHAHQLGELSALGIRETRERLSEGPEFR